MAKSIDISMDSIKASIKKWQDDFNAWLAKAQAWVIQYFQTIDTYGIVAVSAIGLGFVLLIIGVIII